MQTQLTPNAGRQPDGLVLRDHMLSTPGTNNCLLQPLLSTVDLLLDPAVCHCSSQRIRFTVVYALSTDPQYDWYSCQQQLHISGAGEVPWIARSNQPILKEINPEYPLERLMLKLRLQYFGHLM